MLSCAIYHKNIELIDKDGKPNYIIVVGSKGSIQDAISASRIAGLLSQLEVKNLKIYPMNIGNFKVECHTQEENYAGTCAFPDAKVEIEIRKTLPNKVYWELKSGDYLDSIIGNRILDGDNYLGFRIDEKYLGILKSSSLMVDDKEVLQRHALYLTGYLDDQGTFLLTNFTYITTFEQQNRNDYGLQKCFPKKREDNYLAYCSMTSEKQDFIGNKEVYLTLLGQTYLLLDMAVPFGTNLTRPGETIYGGKIALGYLEKRLVLDSGETINGSNVTFYVIDENKIIARKENTSSEISVGELRNIPDLGYVKLWAIKNRKIYISLFEDVLMLGNNQSIGGFRVYLEWTNNLPIVSKIENSKRPDALKTIRMIREEKIELKENQKINLTMEEQLSLSNREGKTTTLDFSIRKNSNNETVNYSECRKIDFANQTKNRTILFSSEKNWLFTYQNITCTLPEKVGVVITHNQKIVGFFLRDNNSLLIDDLSGTVLAVELEKDDLEVILNSTSKGSSVIKRNDHLDVQLVVEEKKNTIALESIQKIEERKSYTAKENESIAIGEKIIRVKEIEIESQPCSIRGKNLRCELDKKSYSSTISGEDIASRGQLSVFVLNERKHSENIAMDNDPRILTTTKYLIIVGGYKANAFAGGMKELTENEYGIFTINNRRIVLAGYSAVDTRKAVDAFLDGIVKQARTQGLNLSYQ